MSDRILVPRLRYVERVSPDPRAPGRKRTRLVLQQALLDLKVALNTGKVEYGPWHDVPLEREE
jgi:hypothetical protein